ncbi:MAG: PQQ-dependent sugar dehydrogenase [Acidimicrobiia bacterium]|nr:PQQ-dependent sugar dehydrogenase [Acidimicrobiia bacterium]
MLGGTTSHQCSPPFPLTAGARSPPKGSPVPGVKHSAHPLPAPDKPRRNKTRPHPLGGDQYGHGQRSGTLLGSLLRIDVDSGDQYGIPADNPFVAGGGAAEVWAYGLRNPWRFSFDDQRLYIADVGQGKWEEIDVLTTGDGGANLGWSIMEGTHCYNPSSGCNRTGLTLPAFEYGHGEGCSVTGGYVYRGNAVPELNGHYFYGDFCSGWVRSFRYTGGGVADLWDWTADLGTIASLTSFGTDGQGELYVVSGRGDVYRIARQG